MFEHALDHAFEQVNKTVEIKGFRKGHAPRAIYRSQMRGVESLYDEAINHALQDTYYEAVTEHNIGVVAQPKIHLEVEKVKRGQDFTYEVTVAVKPEVKLGAYKGVEVKKPTLQVTEEEVEAEIKKELEKNAEMVLKEEEGVLENGDTAVFEFAGSVASVPFEGGTAENHELVIGSGQFIPGFEEQMVGMKPEEAKERRRDVPGRLPCRSLPRRQGSRLRRQTARDRGPSDSRPRRRIRQGSEFGRHRQRHILRKQDPRRSRGREDRTREKRPDQPGRRQSRRRGRLRRPEEMILEETQKMKEQTERQMKGYGLDFKTYLQYMGKTEEQYMDELKAEAGRNLKAQLTIEAVGKLENFAIADEEIEAKYADVVEQYKSQKVTLGTSQGGDPARCRQGRDPFPQGPRLLGRKRRSNRIEMPVRRAAGLFFPSGESISKSSTNRSHKDMLL
ncbi:MAG: trigger factor [Anaerotruncus sp.]|nr:trigger factor [Anaerotruncus sp.]